MKLAFGSISAFAVVLMLWSGVEGGQEKTVTIKGEVCCAKCALSKEKTCMAVVVEKKDGKETIYYFDQDAHTKYHPDICPDPKAAVVTGVMLEKDGKKSIKVKEVKYDK